MASFISFFPALNGDSILIRINDYVMLIDGGYVDTFTKFIKPELEEIYSKNISLNHVIVTHIDKDHISGIIKLMKDNNDVPFIKIDNIWHNSFQHVKQFNSDIVYNGKSVKELSTNYYLQQEQIETVKNVSAVQGSTLASILQESTCNWNLEFNGKAVSTDNKVVVRLEDKIVLKLLSPSTEKLSALNLNWKKELYQKGYATNEDLEGFSEIAFESIIANQKEQKILKKKNVSGSNLDIDELANSPFYEDEGTSNGSSIAFIIEYKKKRLLFLADAHPSTIIANLKLNYKKQDFPLYFDAVKISHHGSQKNSSLELLKMITSQRYVFSTNGKIHNHPDKETIARIIFQKTTYTKELLFTYPLDSIAEFKNQKMMQEYNYQIIEGNASEPIKINL